MWVLFITVIVIADLLYLRRSTTLYNVTVLTTRTFCKQVVCTVHVATPYRSEKASDTYLVEVETTHAQ